MLISTNTLQGESVVALDGEVGRVDGYLFDDEQWTVRYVIVKTGGWLFGENVLISPLHVDESQWKNGKINVGLTRDQVKSSPGVDTAKPVSRQWEADYNDYYNLPHYWVGAGSWGSWGTGGAMALLPSTSPEPWQRAAAAREREKYDAHLRSASEVTGYRLHATDGDLGHICDFLIDDDKWIVRYLAVDTHNWWPGKKVLLPPVLVDNVNWTHQSVSVAVARDKVRNAPGWDPEPAISRDFEEALDNYYGVQHYWNGKPESEPVAQS